MEIKRVNLYHLEQALAEVNKKYDNNVIFNRLEPLNKSCTRWRVTLRVKNSHGKGARLSVTGRHLVSACWHVHGDFFDALLKIKPDAVIKTVHGTIDRNGGNWEDWNIGSLLNPVYYSEACECENPHQAEVLREQFKAMFGNERL